MTRKHLIALGFLAFSAPIHAQSVSGDFYMREILNPKGIQSVTPANPTPQPTPTPELSAVVCDDMKSGVGLSVSGTQIGLAPSLDEAIDLCEKAMSSNKTPSICRWLGNNNKVYTYPMSATSKTMDGTSYSWVGKCRLR